MIETQFGFKADPFSLTADSTIFYRSHQHVLAEKFLEYALESRGPFALLTGEVGCGKSLLVSRLLGKLGGDVTVVLVNRPYSQLDSLRGILSRTLGTSQGGGSDADAYEELLKGFQQRYEQGQRTLLVVDESQNLSVQALEDLRLLSNANPKETFLQMLLVGQSELRAKLHRPELRQFEQRISAQFHLEPLSDRETHAYIVYRLEAAGGDPALFTDEAINFIYAHTGGVPRLINQLCHYALVQASTSERKLVDLDVMTDMAHEFRGGLAFQFEKKPERRSSEVVSAVPAAAAAAAAAAEPTTTPEPAPALEPAPAPVPAAERVVEAAPVLEAALEPVPVPVPEAEAAIPAPPAEWQAERMKRSDRRPAIAAACVVAAGLIVLAVWGTRRPAPPVAAVVPAAAGQIHDAAPPPVMPDTAGATAGGTAGTAVAMSAATPPAVAPAARAPVTVEAARPKSAAAIARTTSSAHATTARVARLVRRALDRVNKGDPVGAERLMSRASAAGARPQDLAELRSRIDSQKLELRLASSADRVKADIATDSLLDPAADSAEKRYEEMSRISPNDPLTARARRDLQRALLAHVQDATNKGEFDVARHFLDAAAKTGGSAEINAAEEKLRQEMSRTALPQASSVQVPAAPSSEDNAGQRTAADAPNAQDPAQRE